MKPSVRSFCLLAGAALLVSAETPWKDKQASEWTEADAKQILTDSPWAKKVFPTVNRPSQGQRGGRGGGMGRGGGLGLPGGIGIGLPGGLGGGRGRGGGGQGPGGGRDGGYPPRDGSGDGRGQEDPPELTVRWESAAPVQSAELKAHEAAAPDIDGGSYTIVVSGIPTRFGRRGLDLSEGTLKKNGEIKREGKKTIKPTSARIVSREEGLLVVYTFTRKNEISLKDSDVEFGAKIGTLEFKQVFVPTEMVYQGKLEL